MTFHDIFGLFALDLTHCVLFYLIILGSLVMGRELLEAPIDVDICMM
jgi:hypothetical protein